MNERITFLDCPIDALTMEQTLSRIEKAIVKKEQLHHVVVNVAKLVNMQKDSALREAVIHSDLINADGLPVVWGARLLGKRLPERVAGVDLMQELVELAAKKGYKIFFLGAKENIVTAVVSKYSLKYGSQIIAGYHHGYFKQDQENSIATRINESGAHILFVAMGSPKKEIFLNTYKDTLSKVNFIMGVGGSFDVVAGFVRRAPLWMQKAGLEWSYRIYQEPKRMWKRYAVTNSLYIVRLTQEWIKSRLLLIKPSN